MPLAQTALIETSPNWTYVLVLIGVATVLFVFITLAVTLVRVFAKHRELLHAERMRSIETGHAMCAPDPDKLQLQYMHNAFWISFWIGLGVPVAAFSSASTATQILDASLAIILPIWICAALASIAAVVCATVLMLRSQTNNASSALG